MVKIAIGLALMWLVVTITRRKLKIEGWLGFILAGIIAYGLGSLVLLCFHAY